MNRPGQFQQPTVAGGHGRRIARLAGAVFLTVLVFALAACFNPMSTPDDGTGTGDDTPTDTDPGSDPGDADDPSDPPTAAEQVLEALQGSWLATEPIPYYDRTLEITYDLTVTDQDVELRVTVNDPAQAPGDEAVNRVTVNGRITTSPTVVSIAYASGTQATSNGDGTFNVTGARALTTNEVAMLESELGGSWTITLETDRFILDEGLDTERLYQGQ